METSKKILVAGAGISGRNAAWLLLEQGKQVVLFDSNPELDVETLRRAPELEGAGEGRLEILCGSLPEEVLAACEYCVISPGIPLTAPFVDEIKSCGLPIIGEVELAFRHAAGKLAAITGTNGKTTTTALVGHLLAAAFPDVYVVGNIGTAYTRKACLMNEKSYTAAEMSSFQLETVTSFRPEVSAILNITPDHLDRHGSLENYAAIKKNICLRQTTQDICVLNGDDPMLADVETQARKVFFSSSRELPEGAFLKDDRIFMRLCGHTELICPIDRLKLLGRHNYENVMAAVLIAHFMGVPTEIIRSAVCTFTAVEHRIEYVCETDGVVYYNDSKGTNTDAAIQAVKAMVRPTILLAGGYDKHADYTPWLTAFEGKVKLLITMGATAQTIAEQARRLQAAPAVIAQDMREAVSIAQANAQPGDAILLSPACASWGMFPNYEVRGKIFKELVTGRD